MICNLPVTVFCSVFNDWVNIKDIARLDSACCRAQSRSNVLQCLSSKQFVFKNPVDTSNNKLLLWLLVKQIKASNLQIRSVTHGPALADYLRYFGKFVRLVHFCVGKMTDKMHTLAIHCREIKSMKFVGTVIDPSFKELLWCNPLLEELLLNCISISEIQSLEGVSLQSLRVLSIIKSRGMFDLFPVNAFSDNLQKVAVGQLREDNSSKLDTFVQHCGGLKSLCVSLQKLSNSVLKQVAMLRPSLLHLDIYCNQFVTDAGLLAIAKSLPFLRSICTLGCGQLTDLSIAHLAEHCGSTLETLYTDVKYDNIAALKSAVGKFTALKFLYVSSYQEVMCTNGATFALVQACPHLRTLAVDNDELICVSSRSFMKLLYPDLKIVLYQNTVMYDALKLSI